MLTLKKKSSTDNANNTFDNYEISEYINKCNYIKISVL